MKKKFILLLVLGSALLSQNVLAVSNVLVISTQESEQEKQDRTYREEYIEDITLRDSDSYLRTSMKIKNHLQKMIINFKFNKNIATSEYFSIKNLKISNVIYEMRANNKNLINDSLFLWKNLEFSINYNK